MPTTKANYWIITCPYNAWTPQTNEEISFIKGQRELGEGGYDHWQCLLHTRRRLTIRQLKTYLPTQAHIEASRSNAAETYCCKEATRYPGSEPFEYGTRIFNPANSTCWDSVWNSAKRGALDEVPSGVRVRNYRTLRAIEKDHLRAPEVVRTTYVYWGPPATGKTRTAWEAAGWESYPKDPCTKYWDGFLGHKHVIIDEFRGGINISHLLRWLDRYPVIVECKFGALSLTAEKIWITSNIHPRDWYPDISEHTREALLRRLLLFEFTDSGPKHGPSKPGTDI